MKLQDVLETLNQLAPEHLAEPWDKVGLHIGDPGQTVRRAMLCIDLNEAVVAEAVQAKVDLIVAYHPPIFQPVERLTSETWKQRVMVECVRRGIAVYSPHTALDAAKGGVNDWLCEGIGKGLDQKKVKPIVVHTSDQAKQFKIVTFVPPSHIEQVRNALTQAHAGIIGNYVECSFTIPGWGTFRAVEGAHPFIGEVGKLEKVDELRMEMVCEARFLPTATEALRRAHPYEEPAFDIRELTQPPSPRDQETGQGRIIMLNRPISPATLVRRLRKHLGVKHLEVAIPTQIDPEDGPYRGEIRTVAVCAGAGGSVVAREEAGYADAWFTGEMRHHDVLDAVQNGRVVILAGHTQTERPYLPRYRERIIEAGRGKVEWAISETDNAPSAIT